jgi:hypothetical protein
MASKKVVGCTVSIEYDEQGRWTHYFAEKDTEEDAINSAVRRFTRDKPFSTILQKVPSCNSYFVDDPRPDDVIEEITASRISLKFQRLRNGLLQYRFKGSAWQNVMWDSGPMNVKDIAFRDDMPEPDFGLASGAVSIEIPLVVMGGDDRLLFLYLSLEDDAPRGNAGKRLKEARSNSWIYFGWPDPNNSISEAMKVQSIRSLSWDGVLLKVTVVGGDGRTCTTSINTVFVPFPGPGGHQTFPVGWSCS